MDSFHEAILPHADGMRICRQLDTARHRILGTILYGERMQESATSQRHIDAIVIPEKDKHIKIRNGPDGEEIASVKIMRRNRPGERELLVEDFKVTAAYENQGYALMLMNRVKKILRDEDRTGVLSVHASNSNAQGFYLSQGWEFDEDARDMMPNRGQQANNLLRWMVLEPEWLE